MIHMMRSKIGSDDSIHNNIKHLKFQCFQCDSIHNYIKHLKFQCFQCVIKYILDGFMIDEMMNGCSCSYVGRIIYSMAGFCTREAQMKYPSILIRPVVMIQSAYVTTTLCGFYLVFGLIFILINQMYIISLQPSRDAFDSCFGVAVSHGNLVIATV